MRAWRERIAAGKDDRTTRSLEFICHWTGVRQQALEGFRFALGDGSPRVRQRALANISLVGDLDDFSLLMDLLKLAKEELDDKERLEIVQTLRRLAVRLKVYGEDAMN
ncbi:MAG: hypothetical protein HYS13_03505 [Planctomycetia bacterium]|nr:hypothetical protein [Planctomycetia bacterium]